MEERVCSRCGKADPNEWYSKSGYCKTCAEELLDERRKAKRKKYAWALPVALTLLVLIITAPIKQRNNERKAAEKAKREAELYSSVDANLDDATEFEEYETVYLSGSGDDVVDAVIPVGVFRILFSNSGERNFTVWDYFDDEQRDLLVNEIGGYTGSHILFGGTHEFEVKSDGNWTIKIEKMPFLEKADCSGKGDACIGVIVGSNAMSGVYKFNHNGDGNYTVWLYSADGSDLLVNQIGRYDGSCKVKFAENEMYVWGISADGSWSIKKED